MTSADRSQRVRESRLGIGIIGTYQQLPPTSFVNMRSGWSPRRDRRGERHQRGRGMRELRRRWLWRAAARTRRVVLGGVGEYFELFEQFHGRRRHCIYVQYSTPSRAVHKARIAANAAAVPDLSYFSVDKLNSGGFCLHTTSQLAGGAVQSLQPRAESTYRRFEASVLSR